MANGWTNAKNFKVRNIPTLSPSRNTVSIPQGTFLLNDVTIPAEPNYISTNIIQGGSIGDIQYGSANTPIDNSGCGTYYPKGMRTPYTILGGLYSSQTLNDFNNHMIASIKDRVVVAPPKKESIYAYSGLSLTGQFNSYSTNLAIPQYKNGRVYKGDTNIYGECVCIANDANTVYSGIVGSFTSNGATYGRCIIKDLSYDNINVCFLMPVKKTLLSGESATTVTNFVGMVQYGTSYNIITSTNGNDFYVKKTFNLSQTFAGVVADEDNVYIFYNGGAVYAYALDNTSGAFILNTNSYNIIDVAGNGSSTNRQIYATSQNRIYKFQSDDTWVEWDFSVNTLWTPIGGSGANWTEWITYIKEEDVFVIGSTQVSNLTAEIKDGQWSSEINPSTYYPCHCFIYHKYSTDSYSEEAYVSMYTNFIYMIYDGRQYLDAPGTVELTIKG